MACDGNHARAAAVVGDMRRALAITILAAGLASGCGSAVGGGSTPAPDRPVSHDVPPSSQPPTTGRATQVIPRPGEGDSWPVQPVGLRAGVGDDGRAWAWASWWGGIPTCNVLRPVAIQRTGHVIRLDLREGSDAPPGTVCAEIAMLKAVRIDLGLLPPGTYLVRAGDKRATFAV